MKPEPSKLAQLVVAYRKKFGRHVPESCLRLHDAAGLATALQDSLATGVPLSETARASPLEFSPHGCIRREETPVGATRRKGPNGEWLH
jgi:hypothetical protein